MTFKMVTAVVGMILQVSLDNYMALREFIKHYPEFSTNDFYITGESYGGIYVPTLASRVIDDRSFNFKVIEALIHNISIYISK